MKTIGKNGIYIDYTHGNSGVRVWRDQCQVIERESEKSEWVGQDAIHPIPIPDSILGFPHGGIAPATALAAEVARYDDKESDPELRGLLKQWMVFEEALATE
jgi:hypothetical protein